MADTLTPKQRHRLEVEAVAPRPLVCALSHRGGCSGRLEADHVIEIAWMRERWRRANSNRFPLATLFAERLRAVAFDELVADGRNGWLLCVNGHHAPKTRRLLRAPIERRELPPRSIEFAEFFGFDDRLEGLGGGVRT